MADCPTCEFYKQRAKIWRDEAYKLAGHPLPRKETSMTQDEIIELARQAGLHIATDVNWMPIVGLEYAERFAKLVAAKEREQGEPVAFIAPNGDLRKTTEAKDADEWGVKFKPLYTTPQRTWVGLTDEDKQKLATGHPYASWEELCSTVEAKLKEKNT